MQHCWMLHVASVCTPCCMLLRFVGSCCAKFEVVQTFSYVQTDAITLNIVRKQFWELLRPFARSFRVSFPFFKRNNRELEVKHHVYVKRQTRICSTWPSFPFTCRLLFIISTHKLVVSCNFLSIRIALSCFICSFSILRHSRLKSDVCRLPYTSSLIERLKVDFHWSVLLRTLTHVNFNHLNKIEVR